MALATALGIALSENKWVWLADDVQKAFDHIPFERFLAACRAHFPEAVVDFLRLIADKGTRRGIRQGNPFSPLAANIFFDWYMDRCWHRDHPDLPIVRYIDDMLLVCDSVEQATLMYTALASRATAMVTPLKGSVATGVLDLSAGATTDWLGYRIGLEDGTPVVRISERAWQKLSDRLSAAYLTPLPPIRAEQIIRGWLGYLGPCYAYENRAIAIDRVRDIASQLVFDEIPCAGELERFWSAAHARRQRQNWRPCAAK